MNFFRHVIKDIKKTGAVAPSSRFLAQNLVESLRHQLHRRGCQPLNILELGPGSGPLTKEIVKLLRPADHLDIVEIQEGFYQTIKDKYEEQNIDIFLNDISRFKTHRTYDFIFSSLPYENMDSPVSRAIWEKKLTLCSQHAYICYFKYVQFRKFKNDFEEKIVKKYKQNKKIVLRNLPPAKIYTLEIDKTESDRPPLSHIA